MKVLITGAHGFVGKNLVKELQSQFDIIQWDILSNDVLPEADAVIHLAGKAHDTSKKTEEKEYFNVNYELTKKIFDQFLGSKAKKFIFFSSIKAKDGDTPYAKSKLAAEKYIKATDWGNKVVYILRPCMIHGEGVKGNLPLLFKFVKKEWPWPLAAFENKRSYASMGNVSFVVNQLLNRDVKSGIYNVCDDEFISTNQMIELICQCIGLKCRFFRIPKLMVRFCARIGDLLSLPLNTERLGKLTDDYVVDNSEIKKALEVDRMPIRALDGLKYTICTLKRNR